MTSNCVLQEDEVKRSQLEFMLNYMVGSYPFWPDVTASCNEEGIHCHRSCGHKKNRCIEIVSV